MKKLKGETVLYGVSKYATVAVTLLTSAILSRLLSPKEFGVVTVVTVFTAFFTVLSDMGLGTAVIQNKEITENETNDIFSFSVYCALLLAVLFLLLGFPIASFYNESVYHQICAILSLSVLFNAMNIIPNAVLMKEKRFGLVGLRLIVTALLSGGFAIYLALSGASYFALVWQSVFQAVIIFLWNILNSGLRFRLRVDMDSVKKIRQFSLFQFLYNLINYFARNLDNLLIGKVMGKENLAYYDKGYKLMMYPVQNLTYVMNPIIHPILSDYQNEKDQIYNSYMKIVKVLSLLGVIITAVCFWSSREIVLLFFGRQWELSVPVFRLLSVSVWPQMVSSSAGSIYQSTGNTRLMFKSGLIHFGIAILFIVVGVILGDLQIIAALVSISLYLRFLVDYYFLIVKNFRYPYRKFFGAFAADAQIAVVLAAVIALMSWLHVDSLLLSLVVKCLLLGAAFIGMMLATGQFREVLAFLKSKK